MEHKSTGASNTSADQKKREQHLKEEQPLSSDDPVEGKPEKETQSGSRQAHGQGGFSGDDPVEGSLDDTKPSRK